MTTDNTPPTQKQKHPFPQAECRDYDLEKFLAENQGIRVTLHDFVNWKTNRAMRKTTNTTTNNALELAAKHGVE